MRGLAQGTRLAVHVTVSDLQYGPKLERAPEAAAPRMLPRNRNEGATSARTGIETSWWMRLWGPSSGDATSDWKDPDNEQPNGNSKLISTRSFPSEVSVRQTVVS